VKYRLLVDDRWSSGGIKRFAGELLSRINAHFEISEMRGHWRLNDPLSPLWMSAAVWRKRPDVFWSPGFMPPLSSPAPFIFTIHDLIHLHASGGLRAAYFASVIRPLCRKAYKIVTVSEFSRNEICEWAGLSADHVVKVCNAVTGNFTPHGPKFSPGYPYLLYVGARKPHKNLPRVLQVFARSGLSGECRLLLSGDPDDELQSFAAELQIANDVRFAGHIYEAKLPKVYRGALGVVMLSTYEGFGLPALEGMGCGTPVLCSNTTSLPEVVGNAALLVDPTDIEAIAFGMQRIVHDESIRAELIRGGLARCSVFNWDASASTLSALLKEAAESRKCSTGLL
jgi:glycosyltransferase involved in cell wall biosynthesis